jgi:hypothetical protein
VLQAWGSVRGGGLFGWQIDVEGAEYDIMRRLLTAGLHDRIDLLGVEWHHNNWQVLGE